MVNDGGLLIARGLVHKNEQYKLNLEGPGINNAHLILVGESGSGKTTLLVKIINEMVYKAKENGRDRIEISVFKDEEEIIW